jgi:FtsP/CotA-like multicopper oxidase with cupredoxin domain
MGMMGGRRGGMGMGMCSTTTETVTLMTVSYDGTYSPAQNIPASINPEAKRVDPYGVEIANERELVLSMGMMGMMGIGQGQAYINGKAFGPNPYTITSDAGTYEIWTIFNSSGMDHPFHQHVNPAQVLSVRGGDWGYASLYSRIPAWKDTVLVPAMGSVTILVPIMDFTGTTVFHCHILEHEDIGMMGLWNIT